MRFYRTSRSVKQIALTTTVLLLGLASWQASPHVPVVLAAPTAANWCIAGGFQGWDNASTPLVDDGSNGDLVPNDGIFSSNFTVATAGTTGFKVVECGNWGNAFPPDNAYVRTTVADQVVRFTFDTNNHSTDVGPKFKPSQNIVHAFDDVPSSFTAVGDFQSPVWTNNDPLTLLTAVGHGLYRLEYTVPTAGTYNFKVVSTGDWNHAYNLNGRGDNSSNNTQFTTTTANEKVVFVLDINTSRLWVGQHGTPAAGVNWCATGDFQGWDNASTPLYDDGTHGDLIGGDGVYSSDVTIAAAGRTQWKAVTCGNWSTSVPAGTKNAFLNVGSAGQVVKLTLDTNNHAADAGWHLYPDSNILHALDTPLDSYTAVGDFQGWDNANAATTLSSLGSGWFGVSTTVATGGNHQGKLVGTGAWANQIGSNGRISDDTGGADTHTFATLGSNQPLLAVYNWANGRSAFIPTGVSISIDSTKLYHDSRDPAYRNPGGAVTYNTPVTLRLRSKANDLTGAKVRLWNDRNDTQSLLPMTKVASDGTYDWWEAVVPGSPIATIYYYRFIAEDHTLRSYYEDDAKRTGGVGQAYSSSPDISWQLTVYDPAFTTPDWVKNGIMYQIFPDRFRDGSSTNDPVPGGFFYGEPAGTINRSLGTDWNTPICDPRATAGDACDGSYSRNFYGGDLQGILDKLSYLKSLGVTVIYLNPIFESPSNHKYDTADYSKIDPHFGDLTTFQNLTNAAHAMGMKVVLDGVFNHTSSDSAYFDRYQHYASIGSCESTSSPYRAWYYFTAPPTTGTAPCDGPNNYESWFGYDSLPKLQANTPAVRELIWSGANWATGENGIARYWMQWADGWRLDVGGDVDAGVTNSPTNDYWEGFRTAVRTTKSDAYIVGEEWGIATAWTLGSEWDATMNYQFSSAVLSYWRDETFSDNDHNTGSSAGELNPISSSDLNERLLNLQERYPRQALQAMMNLLGSHDTSRALFMLDQNADTVPSATIPNPYLSNTYDWSDAITRLKGVALLQMTLPGAPTIYYGDEIGLVAPPVYSGGKWEDDPYNRVPYPWDDSTGTPYYPHLATGGAGKTDLLPYYTKLTGIRNMHPALRTGSVDTLITDNTNKVYSFGRMMTDRSDAAVVIVNRGTAAQNVTVNLAGWIANGTNFVDVLNGNAPYTVSTTGTITVPNVPAMNGAILVLSGTTALPPAAPVLSAVSQGNETAGISWAGVPAVDEYLVYRSILSGGAYSLVATVPSTTTSYTDTAVSNGVKYYYVVVSKTNNGLVSTNSNEIMRLPQHTLESCVLETTGPLTHTISTTTSTSNIFGDITITNFTGGITPATGVKMQLGYAYQPGLLASPTWTWLPMTYSIDNFTADSYKSNILPDTVGVYFYTIRCSVDGGNSWVNAIEIGVLNVVTSTDTTAPAAPTNLTLVATSPSNIDLSWTASTAADTAGYRIFRREKGAVSPAGDWREIGTTTPDVTSFSDIGVTSMAEYEYYVEAFDGSFNNSAPSNIITAKADWRMVNVTFRVRVPDYSPGTVYVVGGAPEICGWCNPQTKAMTQVSTSPNIWEYTLMVRDGTTLQYKYTRGTWNQVEDWGTISGLANRSVIVSYGTTGGQIIDNTAIDWQPDGTNDAQKAVQRWTDDPTMPKVYLPIVIR